MNVGHMDELTGARFLRVKNAAVETIPAFAAMRLTGLNTTDGYFTVAKPNAASLTERIVFNGPVEIPYPDYGNALTDFPVLALCHQSDTAPANGDNWGTENGGWKLRKGNTGFVAVGNLLTTTAGHYAQVVRSIASTSIGDASYTDFNVSLTNDTYVEVVSVSLGTGLWLVVCDCLGDISLVTGTTGINGYCWMTGEFFATAGTGTTLPNEGSYIVQPKEVGSTYPVGIGSAEARAIVTVTAAMTLTYRVKVHYGSGCTVLAPNAQGSIAYVNLKN